MNTKRMIPVVLSVLLAGAALLFLASWRAPQGLAATAETQAQPASSLPAQTQPQVSEQFGGDGLVVIPDPPMAHEPTEIRVFLHNDSDVELVRYAQFYWANFGIGLERFPIGGRIPFVLPPHGAGTAFVMWVPPELRAYSFFVDIFDAPGALDPIAAFHHALFQQAFPDPAGGLFIEVLPYPLRNPLDHAANISLEVTTPITPLGWEVALFPAQVTLAAGEAITAHVIFTYTPGMPPWPIEQIFTVHAIGDAIPLGSFSKLFGAPLRLHLRAEPPYAESEISVFPYPIPPGEPAEICAEVRNVTRQPREALVFLSVAPFGIGMSYEPIAPPVVVFIPELGMGRACVHWVAPDGGQFSFEARVETPGYPGMVASQRVLDVGELLLPGTVSTLHFPVRNPMPEPVTITLGLIPHLPDWGLSLYPDVLENMAPYETRWVTMTVEVPPGDILLLDEAPVADVEAFVGQMFIGGFRKIYRPPVPIHRPGEPIYAESEIIVRPYPPREREPTEICVELRNPASVEQVMFLDLRWAEFGVGLPWHLIRTLGPIFVPPQGMAIPCTMWVAPHGGLYGFEVEVHIDGVQQSFFSQRVIDVGEILLPNQPEAFTFPVGNPFPHPIIVTLGAIRRLPQWEVWLEPNELVLDVGQVQPVTLHVIPIQRPGDPEPREGMPVIDVEAWWHNGEEHGLLGGFRKLFFPPVPAHRPQDPIYAESEIHIAPYPPRAGEPTEIMVEVRNPTNAAHTITATIEVGSLGIGLPFNPIHTELITMPPESATMVGVVWVPPFAGEFCVRVWLQLAGHEAVYSARNVSIVRLPEPYGLPEVSTIVIGDNGVAARPLTVTLGLIEYLPDWSAALDQQDIIFQAGQSVVTVTLTITPPANPADLPRDGGPIADVEAYADGELIGGIRKVWRPPVPLGNLGEPTYAESEISISPDPPAVGQPATFGAVVRNNTDYTQTIHIQFGWADFGVGIPFTTTNVVPSQTVITLGPFMTTTVNAQWTPLYSGNICVQIILYEELTGQEQVSQRNVHVIELPEEPCEPFTLNFWLQNATPLTVTVTLGSSAINLPPDWEYTIAPTETVLAPFAGITVTVTITPPCTTLDAALPLAGQASGSAPKIQVEGYDESGQLIGGVELQLVASITERIFLPLILKNPPSPDGEPVRGTSLFQDGQPGVWTAHWPWLAALCLAYVGALLKRMFA